MKNIAVTGASGCIGSALVARLCLAEHRVFALARDPERVDARASYKRFDLANVSDADLPGDVHVLVHCAYDASDPAANLEGTRRLFTAARSRGVQVIFLSSFAAHEGALSAYGRLKNAGEMQLDAQRDAIVRPGLVLARCGLFGRIERAVRSRRPLPVFRNAAVQTILREDLVEAIERIVDADRSGVYHLADPTPTALIELYRAIAERTGSRPWLIPMPLWFALAAVRTARAAGVRLPLDEDRLLGIKAMRRYETAADAARLGVSIRSFSQSMDALYPKE